MLIKLVSEIPERAQRTNYTIHLRAMLRVATTANGDRREDEDEDEDEGENEDEVAGDDRTTGWQTRGRMKTKRTEETGDDDDDER